MLTFETSRRELQNIYNSNIARGGSSRRAGEEEEEGGREGERERESFIRNYDP
jgi:hypothetical protein